MNLKRINELAHKQKLEGLTDEEKDEQALLRKEYIAEILGDVKSQLDNTYILDKDGNKIPLKKKD